MSRRGVPGGRATGLLLALLAGSIATAADPPAAPPAIPAPGPPHPAQIEAPTVRAGDPGALLVIKGQRFQPDSTVQVNGHTVPSRFQSPEELVATIPPELLTAPGTLPISVATPGAGGGTTVAYALTVLPPLPGRYVAFTSSRRGGRNHIFLLDRQVGRLDPLEEANSIAGSDGYPTISADGRFIAFQSDRNRGQNDIFLFDRQTRTLDPLPEANHPTAFDGFPHISADGRFIVFESDRVSRRPKLFLFDRQTRTLTELIEANDPAADNGLGAISN
jgi:dipeptidyl aminopeptidase/acylaminoacyl peptidase